jgi:hypothetical protein
MPDHIYTLKSGDREGRHQNRSVLAVCIGMLATVVAAPSPAYADPQRPMPPNACPGGKMSMYGSPTGHGWCDGTQYPDRSFWRAADFELPNPPPPQCVINANPFISGPAGTRVLVPAPPGGCGGAV